MWTGLQINFYINTGTMVYVDLFSCGFRLHLQESEYVPFVKEFVQLQKDSSRAEGAANALVKQSTKKPSGKAKAKAKAAA